MMIRSFLACCVAVVMLAGCVTPNSATQDATAPERASGGLLGLGEASDFDVATGKAFNGASQVVIGGFKVGFVESKSDSITARGGLMSSGFGGKSSAHLKLDGVDESLMQEITETAYADFVAQLKAAGYTVIEPSDVLNSPEFKGVKRYDMPYEVDNSGILSDYGVTRYFSPVAIGNKAPIFMGEILGVTGGFGFSNPASASAEYAKRTNTRILNVAYVVDFSNSNKHGSMTTSSVNVGQGVSIVPGAVVGITGGHMGTFSSSVGSIRTGQPIYSTDTFGEVVDSTSTTSKSVEVATNVIGLIGGIGTNVSRNYEVKADPAQYKAVTLDVTQKANKAFLDQMLSLR